jgi:hypothetical protein
MKRLQRIVLFADAHELDRLSRDIADRQRSATARVTIHLRQHYTRQRQLFMKFIR